MLLDVEVYMSEEDLELLITLDDPGEMTWKEIRSTILRLEIPLRRNWRPVRESNPCRRREREATYCNSRNFAAWIALYRT